MKPTSSALCLALAAWGASPCASAGSTAAPVAASAPANAASSATVGNSSGGAACPARPASASLSTRRTSKARHTIVDGDPCADPHSAPGER